MLTEARYGEQHEKENYFRQEIKRYLQRLVKDEEIWRKIRMEQADRSEGETEKTFQQRQKENDLQQLKYYRNTLYDLAHENGLSTDDLYQGIEADNKDQFVEDFDQNFEEKIVAAVQVASHIKQVGTRELALYGKAEQAKGFVHFRNNARVPIDARIVRFYINASPLKINEVAAALGKISDQLEVNRLLMQFKVRRHFEDYTCDDTCITYVFIPPPLDGQTNQYHEWIEKIKEALTANISPDMVRPKNSFFTKKIADGLSYVEDSRYAEDQHQSYTHQITDTIAEIADYLSDRFSTFTDEAIEAIANETTKKLLDLNY